MKIKRNLSLVLLIISMLSCGLSESRKGPKHMGDDATEKSAIHLKDTTILFLWKDMKYIESLGGEYNSLFLNQEYLKVMTDAEKAAIGYFATFIGNECWWDGDAKEDRSNLDCKIITALGLGYQCSDKHLGFLRKWFSQDEEILAQLETSHCPTTPYTATTQNTFDEISMTIKDDVIIVFYRASGFSMRTEKAWTWSETSYFELNADGLILVDREKSEVVDKPF